jgi:hypothetical protein
MSEHWALQMDPTHLARIIRATRRTASMATLRRQTWAVVRDIFLVGSTSACKICERAGIDPYCALRRIPHV